MKRHEYIRQFYGLVAALSGVDMPVDAKLHAGSFGADADVDDGFYGYIQGAVNAFPAFKSASLAVDTKSWTNPDPATLLTMLKRGIARAARFTEPPSATEWRTEGSLRDGVRSLAQHIFESSMSAVRSAPVQGAVMPVAVAVVRDPVVDFVAHEVLQHPERASILTDAMQELKTPEDRYMALERILGAHDAYLRANAASECPPIEVFRTIVERAMVAPMAAARDPSKDVNIN